jgi:hypothetical protein
MNARPDISSDHLARRRAAVKIVLAALAWLGLGRRADAAPTLKDSVLSGTTSVASGASLTIAAGATLSVSAGATLSGLSRPLTIAAGGVVRSIAAGDNISLSLDAQGRLTIVSTVSVGEGGTGGEPDERYALAPRFAVFCLPLGVGGAKWTDFELKGSVNNFEGFSAEALVYFYGSQYGTQQSTHGRIGETTAVYYTDDLVGQDHGAARKWRLQDVSRSLAEQRSSYGAIIGGVVVVIPCSEVIRPTNPALRWVWQRVSPAVLEEVWVPVLPSWVVTAPLASQSGGTGGEYIQDKDPVTDAPVGGGKNGPQTGGWCPSLTTD